MNWYQPLYFSIFDSASTSTFSCDIFSLLFISSTLFDSISLSVLYFAPRFVELSPFMSWSSAAHGDMEEWHHMLIARRPEATTMFIVPPAPLFVHPLLADWGKVISLFLNFRSFPSLIWRTWRIRKDLAALKIDRITMYLHCPTTSVAHRVI